MEFLLDLMFGCCDVGPRRSRVRLEAMRKEAARLTAIRGNTGSLYQFENDLEMDVIGEEEDDVDVETAADGIGSTPPDHVSGPESSSARRNKSVSSITSVTSVGGLADDNQVMSYEDYEAALAGAAFSYAKDESGRNVKIRDGDYYVEWEGLREKHIRSGPQSEGRMTERVVIKEVPIGTLTNWEDTLADLRFLLQVDHVNIVLRYLAAGPIVRSEKPQEPFLVAIMQLPVGGTLTNWLTEIESSEPTPVQQSASWLRGLAVALEYLHNHFLVHGQLDPDNVAIDGNGTCKLLSLGMPVPDTISGGYKSANQLRFAHMAPSTRNRRYIVDFVAYAKLAARLYGVTLESLDLNELDPLGRSILSLLKMAIPNTMGGGNMGVSRVTRGDPTTAYTMADLVRHPFFRRDPIAVYLKRINQIDMDDALIDDFVF